MTNNIGDDIATILDRQLIRLRPDDDGDEWARQLVYESVIDADYPHIRLSALLDACDAVALARGALVERDIITDYYSRAAGAPSDE